MNLRLKILRYIKEKSRANFFQMARDLNLHTDDLARELKILADMDCLKIYEGGFYSLTPNGLRELNQLEGKIDPP